MRKRGFRGSHSWPTFKPGSGLVKALAKETAVLGSRKTVGVSEREIPSAQCCATCRTILFSASAVLNDGRRTSTFSGHSGHSRAHYRGSRETRSRDVYLYSFCRRTREAKAIESSRKSSTRRKGLATSRCSSTSIGSKTVSQRSDRTTNYATDPSTLSTSTVIR